MYHHYPAVQRFRTDDVAPLGGGRSGRNISSICHYFCHLILSARAWKRATSVCSSCIIRITNTLKSEQKYGWKTEVWTEDAHAHSLMRLRKFLHLSSSNGWTDVISLFRPKSRTSKTGQFDHARASASQEGRPHEVASKKPFLQEE